MATQRNVLPPPSTDEEIERQRQEEWKQLLKEFKKDNDRSTEGYMPGTYPTHAAFHLSSVLQDMVGRHLLEHPSIIADEVWYRHAYRAHEELFALYQEMGVGHFLLLLDEKAAAPAPKKTRPKKKPASARGGTSSPRTGRVKRKKPAR